MQDAFDIPTDLEACQALLATLLASLDTVESDRNQLKETVEEQKLQIGRLLQLLYGRRSERRVDSPDQQRIAFPDDQHEIPEASVGVEPVLQAEAEPDPRDEELVRSILDRRRRRREVGTKSAGFPAHLPRREIVLDLSPEEKAGLTHIGDDVSERLIFEAPRLVVERTTRPKYVRAKQPEAGVAQAPAPLSIIPGCRFDFSVIAQVLQAKYWLHCPLYRQQDDLARLGWNPSRSTLCHLVGLGADALVPLAEDFHRRLMLTDLLGLDETHVTELCATAKGGSKETRAWLVRGLEEAPLNVFHYFSSREQRHVDELLATFSGVIVADCYTAYENISKRSMSRIAHAACNAHARRKFVEAESASPLLAAQALAYYRRLYDVEDRGRDLSPAARLELRQREAVPIWEAFSAWLRSEALARLLPKNKISEALGYLRNHEAALQRYLSDGRIPMDNNDVEQTLRGLTTGRRNWMFLGSERGGERLATILSVISSAHRHNLDVNGYLEDCLKQLSRAQQESPADLAPGSSLLTSLLPHVWAQAHPESIRTYRQREKELVGEAKRLRRARRRLLECAKGQAES